MRPDIAAAQTAHCILWVHHLIILAAAIVAVTILTVAPWNAHFGGKVT